MGSGASREAVGEDATTEPLKDFPQGSKVISSPESPNVEIIFIHEITESRDTAWRLTDSSEPWIAQLSNESPTNKLPDSRIVSFGYDASDIKSLADLLDSKRLTQCAKALLRDYPLRKDMVAGGTLPVIFVAHGFGGLIYEKAVTLSYQADNAEANRREHAVILLDTPHHGAGMAEWAIICAKQLGIPCADTAQQEDWSPFKEPLADIEAMQRLFRGIIRTKIKVDIIGGYATKSIPGSKLRLASEWVVLPDFRPATIHSSHFEMTKLKCDDAAYSQIIDLLAKLARSISSEVEEAISVLDSSWILQLKSEREKESEGGRELEDVSPSSLAFYAKIDQLVWELRVLHTRSSNHQAGNNKLLRNLLNVKTLPESIQALDGSLKTALEDARFSWKTLPAVKPAMKAVFLRLSELTHMLDEDIGDESQSTVSKSQKVYVGFLPTVTSEIREEFMRTCSQGTSPWRTQVDFKPRPSFLITFFIGLESGNLEIRDWYDRTCNLFTGVGERDYTALASALHRLAYVHAILELGDRSVVADLMHMKDVSVLDQIRREVKRSEQATWHPEEVVITHEDRLDVEVALKVPDSMGFHAFNVTSSSVEMASRGVLSQFRRTAVEFNQQHQIFGFRYLKVFWSSDTMAFPWLETQAFGENEFLPSPQLIQYLEREIKGINQRSIILEGAHEELIGPERCREELEWRHEDLERAEMECRAVYDELILFDERLEQYGTLLVQPNEILESEASVEEFQAYFKELKASLKEFQESYDVLKKSCDVLEPSRVDLEISLQNFQKSCEELELMSEWSSKELEGPCKELKELRRKELKEVRRKYEWFRELYKSSRKKLRRSYEKSYEKEWQIGRPRRQMERQFSLAHGGAIDP